MIPEEIEAQVEKLALRTYKHRFNQWKPTLDSKGWTTASFGKAHGKLRDVIREHLLAGHLVATGYFPTGCRGYHDYVVYWKARKTKA